MLVGLRSRKHIAPFALLRPVTVAEAANALAVDGSVPLAGGIDLIDRLKSGVPVTRVVALSGVDELKAIRREADDLVIGALATHHAIATSDVGAAALPDLPGLWRGVANPRIRFTGTIGGNLASALPHYDGWPAVLALGGHAVLAQPGGEPPIVEQAGPADLRGALLLSIRIPVGPETRHLLADRSLHPTLSVYLGAKANGGVLRSARIAVGCAFPQARAAELPVAGIPISEVGSRAADLAAAATAVLGEPRSDGLASGSYRARTIAVLTRRLLVRLGARG